MLYSQIKHKIHIVFEYNETEVTLNENYKFILFYKGKIVPLVQVNDTIYVSNKYCKNRQNIELFFSYNDFCIYSDYPSKNIKSINNILFGVDSNLEKHTNIISDEDIKKLECEAINYIYYSNFSIVDLGCLGSQLARDLENK